MNSQFAILCRITIVPTLCLAACARQSTPTENPPRASNTPVPQIGLEPSPETRTATISAIATDIVHLEASPVPSHSEIPVFPTPVEIPQGPPENYLIYQYFPYLKEGSVYLYLMEEDTHLAILPDWEKGCLVINSRHQLAFASDYSGKPGVYLLDFPFVGEDPVLVTDSPETVGCPRSWSPDGSLLAISSVTRRDLVLWNGQTFSRIFHTYVDEAWGRWGNGFVWSLDNRLAFISKTQEDDHSEIFYWDGEFTSNLSQNPDGMDWFPSWSPNGQLAFETSRGEGGVDLLVWDGITTRFARPDLSSFANIAPELTHLYMYSAWDSDGNLTFIGGRNLLYIWDGKQLSSLEINVDFTIGRLTWLPDGRIVVVTSYYSNPNGVFVLDSDHSIIFSSSEAIYPNGAWTDWDQLVYCGNLSLHFWDGNTTTEIVPKRSDIIAYLPNGEDVVCSNG